MVVAVLDVVHADMALQIVDSDGIVGEAADNRIHVVYARLCISIIPKYCIEVVARGMIAMVFS